jgi:hypothetical protein
MREVFAGFFYALTYIVAGPLLTLTGGSITNNVYYLVIYISAESLAISLAALIVTIYYFS